MTYYIVLNPSITLEKRLLTKACSSQIICFLTFSRDEVLMDETAMVSIATDVLSFVGPRHVHEPVCHCHEGFAGDNCDQIMNECAKKPCPEHKLCIPVENSELGYKCSCPVGMVGEVSFFMLF